MKCCYCGAPLQNGDHCPSCGKNIFICRKTQQISNYLYNEALKLAGERRLSEAAERLELALRYYKGNTQARNLLGLIDYETGEFYGALSAWNISLTLDRVNNPARAYLDRINRSAQQIEQIRQTVHKFNQALVYCRQHNYDLAEIQLKNILENFPHFIRALRLQALLEMKESRFDTALKLLEEAGRTDASDPDVSRLAAECRRHLTRDGRVRERDIPKEKKKKAGSRYRRFSERAVIGPLMNLVFGLIIGAAVVGFLVLPAVVSSTSRSVSSARVETSETVTAKNQQIRSLQTQIADLQHQLKTEKKAAENAKSASDETTAAYSDLLQACNSYIDKKYDVLELYLDRIDKSQLGEDDRSLYNKLKKQLRQEKEKNTAGESSQTETDSGSRGQNNNE